MKLTKENIKFIDTYLENSNIVFADIRMEMVDHVASEIENRMNSNGQEDFYDIFKEYMLENKTRLLLNNKQFLKQADKKILKAILKELISFKYLITLIAFCCLLQFLFLKYDSEIFEMLVSGMPMVLLVGFFLNYIIYSTQNKLKRFSVVERLGFPFFIVYELSHIIFRIVERKSETIDQIWSSISISIVFILIIVMYKVSFKLFKSYNNRFKNLA